MGKKVKKVGFEMTSLEIDKLKPEELIRIKEELQKTITEALKANPDAEAEGILAEKTLEIVDRTRIK